jgi:PD-(D/E)XK nuclease superfamily
VRSKRNAAENSRRVSLHIGAFFDATWENVMRPWFEAASEAALSSNNVLGVVTPFASDAAFLRSKLLKNNISLLGVKFFTPPQLREFLLADATPIIPLREHLRLLLAIAAEECANSGDTDLAAIAKSVSRAPDNLLRAFDQVSAAGWDFERRGAPAVREIIQRFQALVRQCGFELVHEADRTAMETAQKRPPRFESLLLIGFNAAHWGLWSLLQAAVASARRATVVLEYPREQTRSADEVWVGTWEEKFAPAAPIAEESERARPFAHLIQPGNAPLESTCPENLHFLVGLNATEQARAISAIALKFLEEKRCTRLGILFPRPGALPRLVSELLTHANVPHNDGIGHLAPGEFESPSWNAWLDLQENHQLEPLLRFLESTSELSSKFSIQEMRNSLRSIYREILIDDINVLREHCARSDDEIFAGTAKALETIRFLPEKTTFGDFLAETEAVFTKLNWNSRWTEIEQFTREWSSKLPEKFSRGIYLRWLKEILNSFAVVRAPAGDHRYSRVHLLTYAEAEQREWSHLILAGLNQGEWPKSKTESGFLPDRNIVHLNARATRRGKQGEGHSVLEEGKTFLLSAQDERQIAIRRFASALESVDRALAVTASLLQDSAPERFWNPSELFSEIYSSSDRLPLSQETMSMLREQTRTWLEQQKLFESAVRTDSDAAQTRTAYDARRRDDAPFGQYEFALREPIEREITLRVTEWETAVKTPALIWLRKYLGIENEEPDLNYWSSATGTWVHDWLAKIGGSTEQNMFTALPRNEEIRERIGHAARRFRKTVADLCAAVGRTVPDWWTSGWANAFALADYLGSKLTELEEWPQIAAEWRLGAPQVVSLDKRHSLRVRGRIDLILARALTNDSQLSGADIWIVDYKTGNTKTLSVSGKTAESRREKVRKKLVRGDAIQLGLYGLAARELGAARISLSILSQRTELDRRQLTIDDLAEHKDFWNELYQMQETGIFGLRGAIRNDYGFHPDYPLATLPIDKEFLDEKWVRTHPAFADDEDER